MYSNLARGAMFVAIPATMTERNGDEVQRILGIDPGTATVGYGVVDFSGRDSFQYVGSGVINTPKHEPAGARLSIIRQDMMSLIDEFKPELIAVEAIFFFKNAKTLVPVAQARGVILEVSNAMGVEVAEYTPMQVKLHLTGFGRADKRMVQVAVAQKLSLADVIRPDDASDALAVAVCHARLAMSFTSPPV